MASSNEESASGLRDKVFLLRTIVDEQRQAVSFDTETGHAIIDSALLPGELIASTNVALDENGHIILSENESSLVRAFVQQKYREPFYLPRPTNYHYYPAAEQAPVRTKGVGAVLDIEGSASKRVKLLTLTPQELDEIKTQSHTSQDDNLGHLIARALENKLRASQGPATFGALIEQEIEQRGPMFDAWTETLASEGAIDARQLFRDKTIASGILFTSSAIFVPDKIDGHPFFLQASDVGVIQGPDKYAFSFGFIDQKIKDPDGREFNVLSDLYKIDHQLLDAMVNHGGEAMRDDILRRFQTVATVANHDFIHGSAILNLIAETAIAIQTPALTEVEANLADLEVHALRSHKAVMDALFSRKPEIKVTMLKQAVGFTETLAKWESTMLKDGVAPQEAHAMTSAMAQQYLERLSTIVPFSDPALYRPVKDQSVSVAEAFGRFAPIAPHFTADEAASLLLRDNAVSQPAMYSALQKLVENDVAHLSDKSENKYISYQLGDLLSVKSINELTGQGAGTVPSKQQVLGVLEALKQIHSVPAEEKPTGTPAEGWDEYLQKGGPLKETAGIVLAKLERGDIQVNPEVLSYMREALKKAPTYKDNILFTPGSDISLTMKGYLQHQPEMAMLVKETLEGAPPSPLAPTSQAISNAHAMREVLRSFIDGHYDALGKGGIPLSGFKAMQAAMMSEPQQLAQMKIHVTDTVTYRGQEVPAQRITAEYQHALSTVAGQIGTTPEVITSLHERGQGKVISARAQKDEMKQKLLTEKLFGEQGVIPNLQTQLAAAGVDDHTIRNIQIASERLAEVIERASRSIEVSGIGRGWRSEAELPQAIESLQMVIAPLEKNSQLAATQRELNDNLQQIRASWEEINNSVKNRTQLI